jgi:exodeoxyribonuclease-3
MRVISLYLPNGNPPASEKYTYKLGWMDRLIAFSLERLKLEEPVLLCGDFNVIPAPMDARRPQAWVNDALFLPATREKYRSLLDLGLSDALRRVADRFGCARPLHVLGLHGGRLAEKRRNPHRPYFDVATGDRPPHYRRRR